MGVRKLSCIQTMYFQIFKKEKKKKRIEINRNNKIKQQRIEKGKEKDG